MARTQLPLFKSEGDYRVRRYAKGTPIVSPPSDAETAPLMFLTCAGLNLADIRCDWGAFHGTNLQALRDSLLQAYAAPEVDRKALDKDFKEKELTVFLTPEQYSQLERYYTPSQQPETPPR